MYFTHSTLLSQISEDVGFELGIYHQILIQDYSTSGGIIFYIYIYIVNQLKAIHYREWNLWVVGDRWWFKNQT